MTTKLPNPFFVKPIYEMEELAIDQIYICTDVYMRDEDNTLLYKLQGIDESQLYPGYLFALMPSFYRPN